MSQVQIFSRLHSIKVPEPDIGSHFGFLLENWEVSDVVFNVAGEKFHAHRLVLAARSSVFRSGFYDNRDGQSMEEIGSTDQAPKILGESNQEIVVTDLEPKVFNVRFRAFTKLPYIEFQLILLHMLLQSD